MAQLRSQRRVRGGLLLVLAGAATALGIACVDAGADGANGTEAPSATSTSTATATAAPEGTQQPGTTTPVPDATGEATPLAPVTGTTSPDTPVSATPGTGSTATPGATVAPVDPGFPIVEELAPIESVDIAVMESFPPQYAVHIVSGLPSGCASFLRAGVIERSGTTIRIEVVNTVPAPDSGVACTMIYGLHESAVPLGSDFDSGVTYTVDVNGTITEFTAQ